MTKSSNTDGSTGNSETSAGKSFLKNATTEKLGSYLSANTDHCVHDPGMARYFIEDQLGKGGMGIVYSASDQVLKRDVAVKLTRREYAANPGVMLRFIEEAQITGQLEHPNIIPVYELNKTEDGNVYYSMKRISGHSLADILKGLRSGDDPAIESYGLNDLLEIFLKVGNALAFAHSKGVIHRDVKPVNVVIGEFGEVLLLDWGLARVVGYLDNVATCPNPSEQIESTVRDEVPELTQAGMMAGTPGYAAPEQLLDASKADERSDVYALGALLYAILTLRTPGGSTGVRERIVKTLKGEIISVQDVVKNMPPRHLPNGTVPTALVDIVDKAMALSAQNRYQSISEMADDVESYLSGIATSAEQARPLRKLLLLVKRRPTEAALAGITLITFLVASTWTLMTLQQGRDAMSRAVEKTKVAETAAMENSRLKTAYERDVTAAAPVFAEKARLDLTRMDVRRVSVKETKTGNTVNLINTEPIEKNLNTAIELQPENSEFKLLLGMVYQNPTLKLGVQGDSLALTFRFEEAAAAFEEALKGQGGLSDSSARICDRELTFTKDLIIRWKKGLAQELVMARLVNWFRRHGRQKEAMVYMREMERWTTTRLKNKRGELEKHGLIYTTPNSWTSPSLNTIVYAISPKPDLNPLKGMFIKEISLMKLAEDADLEPLRYVGCDQLAVSNAAIDFDVLSNSGLTSLIVRGSSIKNVQALRNMWSLERVEITNTELMDISCFKGVGLKHLKLCGTKVKNLSGLNTSRLKCLHLCNTQISDISCLKNAPLEDLAIKGTPVSSLRALVNSPLVHVDANNCAVSSLEGLNVSRLKGLYLRNCPLKSLAPLSQAKLCVLNVCGTEVDDLSPLTNVPLRDLNVSRTKVKTIEPLANVKLKTLRMSDTAVTDLTPLKKSTIRFLEVRNSPVTDFSPLLSTSLLSIDIDQKQVQPLLEVIDRIPSLYKITVGKNDWLGRDAFIALHRNSTGAKEAKQ